MSKSVRLSWISAGISMRDNTEWNFGWSSRKLNRVPMRYPVKKKANLLISLGMEMIGIKPTTSALGRAGRKPEQRQSFFGESPGQNLMTQHSSRYEKYSSRLMLAVRIFEWMMSSLTSFHVGITTGLRQPFLL